MSYALKIQNIILYLIWEHFLYLLTFLHILLLCSVVLVYTGINPQSKDTGRQANYYYALIFFSIFSKNFFYQPMLFCVIKIYQL